MEGCLLSRVSESYGASSAADQLQSLLDNKSLPLMFPTTPTLKMNDVISSLLQYKADLCSGTVKTEPHSPLYSPDNKAPKQTSSPEKASLLTAGVTEPGTLTSSTTGILPNSSSLNTTSTPMLPSSSTFLPSSSSTGLFSSNSSLLPPNTSLLPPNTSLLPSSTTLFSSSSSQLPRPSLLQNNTILSGTPLIPSSSLLPSSGLVPNPPLVPTSSLLPNCSNILSNSTASILQGPNPLFTGSNSLLNSSSLLNANQIIANKMCDMNKKSDKTVTNPSTSNPTVNNGVKIFQTKQGYTLLICNGYRYSKISTSSNGKKVYWRCTLRSCKGKVHTDVGGGVVYESTHDHPPMAEEFLFSCHSNRLAKEARQIMRFDPMKALKDEIPYSALESTPTFCKIKDRLNIKKGSSSPDRPMVTEPGSPLKQTFPVPSSPLPVINLDHKEGAITVRTTTCDLLTELNALRLTHHLCDVALCVNGTLIYAHRVVLAAASQYFRLLFLANTKLLSYIELRGVDPESVELLVNFAYTGTLNINYVRVTEMLTAANLLHFTPVVEKCCDYLRRKITPQNCIRMREFVTLQGLTKLQAILDKYICNNWSRVIEHEEIYDARPETLLFFLGNDDLVVQNEADVYQVIIRWVRRSPLYRQFYVVELLRKVRLVQLNAQFLLDNVESEELIRQHRECETLLHQAKNHFLLPERDHGLEDYHFRKRKRKQNVCLLGTDNSRTIAYEYDTTRNSAWEVCSTDLGRTDYCLLSAAQSIYVIGGMKTEGMPSDQVSSYNVSTNTWNTSLCQLNHPRSQASGASDDSGFYVIGGKGPNGVLSDKVEHISLSTHTVSTLPPLPHGVAGAAAYSTGDSILVFGGISAGGASDHVFAYNKSLKLWKAVASMPEKVESPSIFRNADEMIYILTGSNKQFRYNVLLDVWETVTPVDSDSVTEESATLISTSLDGDLYAMRTRKSKLFLDRLEGATLTWSPCCSVDMPLTVQAMCPRPLWSES